MEEQQINEARLDIRTGGFWVSGQQAFFGIRVFDPNACRYLNKSLQQCYAMNELEKKISCNERVLQVDHGTRGGSRINFRVLQNFTKKKN